MEWAEFFDISPYRWHSIITAIVCGGMIGFERQVRGKPVGIRTSCLIILGTYLFITTSSTLDVNGTDPTRVLGQIITGIGFLGAGVMLARDGAVMGVTSAATIWVLAAIGVMIGTNNLVAGVKVSLLVVGILYGVDILENHIKMLSRGVHASIKNLHRRDLPQDKEEVGDDSDNKTV
jgi:putative Mg2+ transporter-C (MgtC) family protein